MNRTTSLPIATLTLFLLAGAAHAQVAPPPTQPQPETPKAPEQPATPPADPNALQPPQIVKPTPPRNLPQLDHKPIVNKGPDGKVIRLTRPIQEVALECNAAIDDATRETITAYLPHRRAEIDRIVVENIDIVERIDSGELERLEHRDAREMIRQLSELTKPLRAEKDFSVLLKDNGYITLEMYRYTQQIMQQYAVAVRNEMMEALPKDATSEQKALTLGVTSFKDRIDEALLAYPKILVEAAGSLDKTLPAVKLDDVVRKSAEAAAKEVAAASDAPSKEAGMRKLLALLPIEQRRELLRKTLELRPPLGDVPVPLHSR